MEAKNKAIIKGIKAHCLKHKGFLSFLFSFIALIISIMTLWYSFFSPFNLDANFGGIFIIPKFNKDNSLVEIKIGVPVIFYNRGAKAGFVEDLAITMEALPPNNMRIIYFPYMFYDSQKMLISKLQKKPEILAVEELFSGIYLPSKKLFVKEILFGMEPVEERLFLNPGEYKFTLYVKVEGKEFEIADERIEKITQDVINNFVSETITVLLPFQWREKFKAEMYFE